MKKIMSHIIQIINDESLSIIISLFVSYFFLADIQTYCNGNVESFRYKDPPLRNFFRPKQIADFGGTPSPLSRKKSAQ